MQLAACNCGTVMPYARPMRNRLSPGCTVYSSQLYGGWQGMTVEATEEGTERYMPGCSALLGRQLDSRIDSAEIR